MPGPLPRVFLTVPRKIKRNIWPWTEGVRARLPEHYQKQYMEAQNHQQSPVHWKPNLNKFELRGKRNPQMLPVQNIPIPVIYPKACDEGLWGGEGIIQGLTKWRGKKGTPRIPKFWKPALLTRVFYSEILDRWMTITVTNRTLDLIDDAFGFDFYILKTPAVDLKSKLGMDLKREMLLTLAQKSMYPDDPVKQEKIYSRYKQFIIPKEEAEWVGLSLQEAVRKQKLIEKKNLEAITRPLKQLYKVSLLSHMKENPDDYESQTESWMSKMNPFVGKSEEKEKS